MASKVNNNYENSRVWTRERAHHLHLPRRPRVEPYPDPVERLRSRVRVRFRQSSVQTIVISVVDAVRVGGNVFIAAVERTLETAAFAHDEDRFARAHHRRGGSRSPTRHRPHLRCANPSRWLNRRQPWWKWAARRILRLSASTALYLLTSVTFAIYLNWRRAKSSLYICRGCFEVMLRHLIPSEFGATRPSGPSARCPAQIAPTAL
jgi:hypothetical protein